MAETDDLAAEKYFSTATAMCIVEARIKIYISSTNLALPLTSHILSKQALPSEPDASVDNVLCAVLTFWGGGGG